MRGPFVETERASHFVDGQYLFHRKNCFDGIEDAMVKEDITAVACQAQNQVRTKLPRLPDRGTRADTVALGFITGCDAAGRRGIGWNDGDRPTPQGGIVLLLDAGEKGIHVDEKLAESHGFAFPVGIMDYNP